MCQCGKICYSRKEAGTIVNLYTRRHHRTHAKKVPCRVYLCSQCGTYHTTHIPLRKYLYEQEASI